MSASSERERMPQRQLGELMTELGLISEEQLATVLEVQQQSKRPLGQIIVELGFASGAAVAHALAMQSGGALRTEYGFALGAAPTGDNEASAEETRAGLPKLRLAPTAVVPQVRTSSEPSDDGSPADRRRAGSRRGRLSSPLFRPSSTPSDAAAVEEVEEAAERGDRGSPGARARTRAREDPGRDRGKRGDAALGRGRSSGAGAVARRDRPPRSRSRRGGRGRERTRAPPG